MRFSKNAGFSALEMMLILILVGVLSFIMWTYWLESQTHQETKQAQDSQSEEPDQQTTEISLLEGKLKTILPDKWVKAGEGHLKKNINDKSYVVDFQFTDTDYLANGNYANNISVYKQTKTAKNTKIYIIKTVDSYVSVSSCEPVNSKACSLSLDRKPVFILLHAYQQGDQYVRELNFDDPDTIQVIEEFVTIVEGLSL